MTDTQAASLMLADDALPGEGSAGDYWALLKPRVMSLSIFTAFVGMMAAPGGLHPLIGFTALLCIAVAAGASGALNMWYDADIDARMVRTRARPIPTGRISRGEALGFGTTLAIGAVAVMGLVVNVTAAALLALTVCFYLFVYTMWLKRRTPQNIVIGGAAGALPPVVGWAAVGGEVSLASLCLFAIIFVWTPPHFWALSLYRRGDYENAGIPMLPVVAGEQETRRQILLYSLFLAPLPLALVPLGAASPLYGLAAAVLGVLFVRRAMAVRRGKGDAAARRLFGFSILYLFLLFAALLVDAGLGALGEL